MDTNSKTAVFNRIKDYIEKEFDLKTEVNTSDGLTFIRTYPDDIGENNGSFLLELCFIPTEEEDDVEETFFQIYSTIALDLDEANYPKIMNELNDINFNVTIGSYGIFRDQRQLYHKYMYVTTADTEDQLFDVLTTAIGWVINCIDDDYDKLMSILD